MDLSLPPPHPCPAATFNLYVQAWQDRTSLPASQLAALLHTSDRSLRAWRSGESPIPFAVAELVRRWASGE